MLDSEFESKKVLVVGGSSGIGSACVRLFAEAGANVCFTYYHSRARAQQLAVELSSERKAKVRCWRLDVTSEAALRRVAANVRKFLGNLDSVVMCQGIIYGKSLRDSSFKEIEDTFETNILSLVKLTRVLKDCMSKGSSIVYIASVSAFAGSYDPVYASSKGAIVSFVKAIAKEFGPDVRVNAVAPGLTEDTGMYRAMPDLIRKKHLDSSLLKKLAKPIDIAESVAFLASSRSSHITGFCLDVNGGEYIR